MGNLKETHFVFPWDKPFGNHKMCLLMGFSEGNTTLLGQLWNNLVEI